MAAAFSALVSLQNNILLIDNHPNHTFSFEKEQIDSLSDNVSFLIDFMESYDNAHGSRRETAEALEMRIACAAQVAKDVIEAHMVGQIRCGNTRPSRFLLDLHKATQKMDYMTRKVTQRMDYIRTKTLNVRVRSGMLEPPTHSSTTAQSTPLLTSSMVGFDDILLQLLHLLTRGPLSRRVIPIQGMGGIGKTMLAINAFKHPFIVQHFDVCLWATISQDYSIQKILAQLLSCVRGSTSGTVDVVRERLYKSLFGLRYLIVLDDMWNLKAWDDMNVKSLFPDTNNGSRVVVTTRNANVANHLGDRVEMGFLDEDNSWDLFCQNAFAEQQGCPPELEETAREIVARCKGLPLAIVVVGGHLRKSPTALAYWENVAQSILYSTDSDEQCLNVLSLSYRYLPVQLKPCLLLLGAFLEDEEINVQVVFKLWIAEGFIEHFDDIRFEDVAAYYLWELLMRNLILVVMWDYMGSVLTFKVHDLVREMCQQTAKKEKFLPVFETSGAMMRERRIVINKEVNRETITFDAPVRCLICNKGRYGINNLYNLKLLRTLSKVVSTLTSESIFQQVNLRYLKIYLAYIPHPVLYYLPSSISLLSNLQILTITVPDQSKVIAPYGIWEMLQLRQIEVDIICLIDPLPVDQANELVIRNLYTLLKVENFRLSEEVCKRIPNVRELQLSYCDEVSWCYCPHNLGCLRQLENLALQFDGNSKWREFAMSLTFPSSLRVLRLFSCGVDWEELTMMVGSLPHLQMLLLGTNSVIGSVWTPVEGKFCHLKTLEIYGCGDLVFWNADNSHFPVLENLYLRDLSKLIEFPSSLGEIATLEQIELRFCSASSTISAMRTLVEQEELANESLQLSVYFRGDEETMESFKDEIREEGLTSSTNLSLHLICS